MATTSRTKTIEVKGKIIVKAFGYGTKKEYLAFYLRTKNEIYILHLMGEALYNSFKLKNLKNSLVTLRGTFRNYIFYASAILER